MKVFGLLGEKLSHSLSPVIHTQLYQHLGIDATYSLFQFPPENLFSALHGIRALGIDGVNVTIPYKVRVMELLDELSDEAAKVGAINTICNVQGRLTGYNTDYFGFGKMLTRYGIHTQGKKAVILGSGGAAKAVVAYLEDHGISDIKIISRNPDNAVNFDPNIYPILSYSALDNEIEAHILINCTPVGMHPNIDASPLQPSQLSGFQHVVDLVYNPQKTLLLKQAAAIGIPAVNGLYMLVAQASAAAELWNQVNISESILESIHQKLSELI